jgi:hypothetical protein
MIMKMIIFQELTIKEVERLDFRASGLKGRKLLSMGEEHGHRAEDRIDVGLSLKMDKGYKGQEG